MVPTNSMLLFMANSWLPVFIVVTAELSKEEGGDASGGGGAGGGPDGDGDGGCDAEGAHGVFLL
jgi:hypothetical protein